VWTPGHYTGHPLLQPLIDRTPLVSLIAVLILCHIVALSHFVLLILV
ncbi:hypothetical protein cypCar_00034884, partial [Cyprinus carpio]